MLPKLPNLIETGDACNQVEKHSYFAYAENTVYEFTVTARHKEGFPKYCQARRHFGDANLVERLTELRADTANREESSETKSERETYKFVKKVSTRVVSWDTTSTRWVVPDMANNRWVELSITRRASSKSDEGRFVASLNLSGADGREIGSGSAATLGDAEFKPQDPLEIKEPATTEALYLVSKPQARYSDAARYNSVQGSVRLKVTLMANGGVGNVTPVTILPHGLTEQAVSAARRIAFLPKTVNGIPISTIVTIDYSFSIY